MSALSGLRGSARAYVQSYAFLMGGARTARERLALVRFIVANWAAELHVGARRNQLIRFRGMSYVAARKVELHALEEIYGHLDYSRHPDFLPAPATTVLDVGSNVGVFALHHAAAGASVIAVEPNSEVHSRLVAAVGANGLLERVVTIRAAVGASPGRGRMVVPGKLSVLGFVDTSVPSTSSSDVDVVTIDGLVGQRSLERIDLLKIDVEGAECEVLRGSSRALQRVQRVLLEYHSDGLLAESLSLLRAAGIVELLRVESPKPGIGILYAARPVDA